MANNPSAIKRVRQTERRTLRNRATKTLVKTLRKKLEEAVEAGDKDAIGQAVSKYSSAVDRAAKRSIFHRNKAANLKSKAVKLAKTSATA
ncbi:MAG: 30S ribosomal protein S20 [Verrucomicrobiota bacterium JB023]|nr:30S ribosomal protein S20 [Verrucomicrobiota bacterium JB023]